MNEWRGGIGDWGYMGMGMGSAETPGVYPGGLFVAAGRGEAPDRKGLLGARLHLHLHWPTGPIYLVLVSLLLFRST